MKPKNTLDTSSKDEALTSGASPESQVDPSDLVAHQLDAKEKINILNLNQALNTVYLADGNTVEGVSRMPENIYQLIAEHWSNYLNAGKGLVVNDNLQSLPQLELDQPAASLWKNFCLLLGASYQLFVVGEDGSARECAQKAQAMYYVYQHTVRDTAGTRSLQVGDPRLIQKNDRILNLEAEQDLAEAKALKTRLRTMQSAREYKNEVKASSIGASQLPNANRIRCIDLVLPEGKAQYTIFNTTYSFTPTSSTSTAPGGYVTDGAYARFESRVFDAPATTLHEAKVSGMALLDDNSVMPITIAIVLSPDNSSAQIVVNLDGKEVYNEENLSPDNTAILQIIDNYDQGFTGLESFAGAPIDQLNASHPKGKARGIYTNMAAYRVACAQTPTDIDQVEEIVEAVFASGKVESSMKDAAHYGKQQVPTPHGEPIEFVAGYGNEWIDINQAPDMASLKQSIINELKSTFNS